MRPQLIDIIELTSSTTRSFGAAIVVLATREGPCEPGGCRFAAVIL
jgi:hypothetical protein